MELLRLPITYIQDPASKLALPGMDLLLVRNGCSDLVAWLRLVGEPGFDLDCELATLLAFIPYGLLKLLEKLLGLSSKESIVDLLAAAAPMSTFCLLLLSQLPADTTSTS